MKGLKHILKFIPAGMICIAITALVLAFPAGCFNDNNDSQNCGCNSGDVKNAFANGTHVCCPPSYPYYCNGTNKCYQTWSDAYYNNSAGCTLPKERTTCP